MKKIRLIIVFLLPIMLFAQEIQFSKSFDVKAGAPYSVIDARSKEYFYVNNSIITVKTDGETVFVQKIDPKTQKEVSKKEYTDFPKDTRVQDVVLYGERLFYFYSVFDNKAKSEAVYMREVNTSTANFNKAILLFKTSGEVIPQTVTESLGFWGFNAGPKFNFYNSFDSKKFMISYRVRPTVKSDKNSYDVLGFQVFESENATKIWGSEVKMPYTEAQMNNISYTVSSEGNAYMIAFKREKKEYELFQITKGSTKVDAFPLAIDNAKYFNTIKVVEDKEGNLNCAGYYANGIEFTYSMAGGLSSQMNINGIYQFSISKNGKVLEENTSEFPLALINQFESNRDAKSNEKREDQGKAGIRDLVLREVIENEDGTTLVIGEQYYIKTEYVGTTTQTFYYYADIIASKIAKDGEVIWMKKLPKTQKGLSGRGGMSYKFAQKDNNIYLMFLDNVKNLSLAKDEAPKVHLDGKGGFLTAYKLDSENGEIEKLSILDVRDINGVEAYQFNTARIFFGAENELFLEVYIKGKKDSMIKIELK